MRVNKRLVEIYEEDFNELIERLRWMNKDDRHVLFKNHSRMLFPKSNEIVNLEDQLIGRRDYIHKFKRSFFIIGNYFFSTNYFGEYNQEIFIKEIGYLIQVSQVCDFRDTGIKKRHGFLPNWQKMSKFKVPN